jgi:hypothetical protein
VGGAKVFDTVTLKKMLGDTATQLAAISGFNAAPINAAYGNIQGVSRDTSYLSVQATTTPLPTVSQTSSNGLTGNNSTATSSSTPGSSSTSVMLQCPNGTLPTIGSGGLQACTGAPAGSEVTGSSSNLTTLGGSQNAATTQQTTGGNFTNQNGITTTSGGYTGTVPSAPASTAIAPPTNVGVSSSDILAEQVQLNAQLTTLRLLLQGANSDRYVLMNSHAVATKQQTTVGFAISLDPPREYKHAVAEVRIVIVPPDGHNGVSIMNMLPSEKTYNVAKVTSHQNQFGAGVVVQPVSIGANTGRSKDRVYLAKDTDTLALQYPSPLALPKKLPFPQRLHDAVKGVIDFERLVPCNGDDVEDTDYQASRAAIVLGWQFRPVLGADYVKGGQRQVFAQLALPAGLNEEYFPTVYVQTRWRAYDSKRQVVGSVYASSCSWSLDESGVSLLTPLRVRNLRVTDIGNGTLKLAAQGEFFSPGITVRSGPNNVAPTVFDGRNVELFASAHDVLQAGDLSVIDPNGQARPFGIPSDPELPDKCGLEGASLIAIPYPDGNSRVTLDLTLGSSFDLNTDGIPQPLVLVGNQVFGLQETPFLALPDCALLVQEMRWAVDIYSLRQPQRSGMHKHSSSEILPGIGSALEGRFSLRHPSRV